MSPNNKRREAAERPQLDWQGRVERLGWNGVGLGRLDDGIVVLLHSDLALFPGEVVTARVALHSGHAEGKVTEWLERDPRRVEAKCDFAAQCGGCSLWEGGDPTSDLKWQMVQDLLSRQLRDAPECRWLPAPPGTLRSRIQLHWAWGSFGFHEAASNTLVPVSSCPMAVEPVSSAVPVLRDALRAHKLSTAPDRWQLAAGTPPELVIATSELQPRGSWALANGQWIPSNKLLIHHLGGRRIQQQPGAFFQACPQWAWEAFSTVFNSWAVSGSTLFDLYGGCGFFTMMLAERFRSAVIVESSRGGCASAEANLESLSAGHEGLNSRVVCADVGGWIEPELGQPGDTILLDPPRAGLTAGICEKLCSASAETTVLIGCDGMAFCRDVKRLAPTWQLDQLAAIDLFPNTPQVEFLGLLRRSVRSS